MFPACRKGIAPILFPACRRIAPLLFQACRKRVATVLLPACRKNITPILLSSCLKRRLMGVCGEDDNSVPSRGRDLQCLHRTLYTVLLPIALCRSSLLETLTAYSIPNIRPRNRTCSLTPKHYLLCSPPKRQHIPVEARKVRQDIDLFCTAPIKNASMPQEARPLLLLLTPFPGLSTNKRAAVAWCSKACRCTSAVHWFMWMPRVNFLICVDAHGQLLDLGAT